MPGRTTRRAIEYADHGWPVAALAVPWGAWCPCGGRKCAAPHLVSDAITTTAEAERGWPSGHQWDIAFVTSQFDVVDLPAAIGAELHSKLITRCPTATAGYAAKNSRRWHFVVETGAFPAEEVERVQGVLHSGQDDWIAASPTRTQDSGRVGWIVEPVTSHWEPCTKAVVLDKVFGSRGITATIASVTDGHG